MNAFAPAGNTRRHGQRAAPHDWPGGENARAIAPPGYGIEFIDRAPSTGAPATATRVASAPMQRQTGGKGQAAGDDGAVEIALWVLDDVVDNEQRRLIPDSQTYRLGLELLYQALAGRSLEGRKLLGRERRDLFDEAVLELRPVLARASEARRASLARRRAGLLRAEAEDRVDSSLVIEGKLVEIPDDRHPREQAAVLRAALPKFVQTLQIANEQLLRLGHKELEEALEHLKEEGETLAQLEKEGHGSPLTRLAALQGLLGLADGWLTLTDEELQHELAHIHGWLPGVTTFGELVKAIVEIGFGAVTFTAALAGVIAKAAGDAALSSTAMHVAGEVGHLLGDVVAGIEIVHGVFVLFDSHASGAQKERAALGIASGVAWFGAGGAASFAVVATYLGLKVAAHLYWQGALGMSVMFMRETFEFMQQAGGSMARVADRLARAGLLLQEEHDPLRAEPLAKIVAENTELLATEIDWFLQHCLPSGKDMGLGSTAPAAWPGNHAILVEAFAPLQPLRSAKSGPALAAAAAAVLEKITWCLMHAGALAVASARRGRLRDVEQDEAKKAQGPQGHEE